MKRKIDHPPISREAIIQQVQASNLQANTPAVGVAMKAALAKAS